MAPILVERGQNFVERDIDECLWTSANLFVGAVADDPVDPGSEGRVTPERIDLPHHAPERILDGLLGILLVTRDSDRQAIRAVAVRRDEPIGGGRFTQTQCSDESPVTVSSRRGGLRIGHDVELGVRGRGQGSLILKPLDFHHAPPPYRPCAVGPVRRLLQQWQAPCPNDPPSRLRQMCGSAGIVSDGKPAPRSGPTVFRKGRSPAGWNWL